MPPPVQVTNQQIVEAWVKWNGNTRIMAIDLGISRTALRKRAKALGLLGHLGNLGHLAKMGTLAAGAPLQVGPKPDLGNYPGQRVLPIVDAMPPTEAAASTDAGFAIPTVPHKLRGSIPLTSYNAQALDDLVITLRKQGMDTDAVLIANQIILEALTAWQRRQHAPAPDPEAPTPPRKGRKR